MDFGQHRIEVGLLLRKAILTSGLLYSAEAWSDVSEADIKRLEQVDSALLKALVKGHSKTAPIFHHLETGTLMLRHIIKINRLMFHHHILNLDHDETVRKVYEKQKENCFKGDWIELVRNDFAFMGIDMDENSIKNTPKEIYRSKIKKLIRKAAFEELTVKKNSLTKVKDIKYEAFDIQLYLKSADFNTKERNLLYSLCSRMYAAKINF